ncbi:MAG TPA: ATP-binding protein [Pyrinomonadaceae bacterium]|nr:ATP-binding protein [Pyrinomonadaceae bacterium]
MLIRFRVENHRSIYKEQELSFVAASLSDFPEKVVYIEQQDIDLLRTVGIYGANASGKSNVLNALKFMQSAVEDSQRAWKPDGGVPRSPFLLDPAAVSKPSFFEVDFLLNGSRYTYGFVVDSKRVLEEWLYAYPQGRKQKWFTRDASESPEFSFSRSLTGENKSIQALTRNNSLFLSAAAQNNHQMLSPIFQWFSTSLEFKDEGNRKNPAVTAIDFRNPEYQAGILSIIQNSDLGITNIDIEDEEISEVIKQMLEIALKDNPERLELIMKDPTVVQVTLHHRSEVAGSDIPIPFSDESHGTQALFALAGPIVEALAKGRLLCVDELDASLHPLMAIEIVKMFNDPKRNPHNAQLLFNTHDTNILECGDLRRDQIWFTEKDANGATHLYPLTDYKARKEENLKRGYLQGRYGAVPYIHTEALFTGKSNGEES